MNAVMTYGRQTSVQRGRLGAYIWWQGKDFLRRGLVILIFGLVGGYGLITTAHQHGMTTLDQVPNTIVLDIVRGVVGLGVLIASAGLVSSDRKSGEYRLLFVKPILIPAFYAQRYIVHLLGLLCCIAMLDGALWWAGLPLACSWVLGYTTLVYLTMGGVSFLLSTLLGYDWGAVILVWIGSSSLYTWAAHATTPLRWVVYLLPPTHRLAETAQAFSSATLMHAWRPLLWLVGYGLTCFGLGLAILWRRPFAS